MLLDTHPTLKSALIRAARHPVIAVPAGRGLDLAGLHKAGRRLLVVNGARIPPEVTVTLPGGLFRDRTLTMGTAGGRDMIAAAVWAKGWDGYERPLPALWAASIRDGDTVLNVGSNTGLYALLAASVAPDVQVHAFEPNPHVGRLLAGNLDRNPQGARVRPVPMAVSDAPGEAELFIPAQEIPGIVPGDATLNESFRPAWEEKVTVTVTTIDQYAADLPGPDVIHLDVETLEGRVLQGALVTLRRSRPVIFLEVLDSADVATIDAVRRESGYVSVRLGPRGGMIADAVEPDGPRTNQALWPEDKLGTLEAACRRLRYRLG